MKRGHRARYGKKRTLRFPQEKKDFFLLDSIIKNNYQ